jgi:hypothetical protein
MEDMFRAIRWSWEAGLEGKFPEKDHLGQDLSKEHGKWRYARRGQPLCLGMP